MFGKNEKETKNSLLRAASNNLLDKKSNQRQHNHRPTVWTCPYRGNSSNYC
jgi:hypothetical protein